MATFPGKAVHTDALHHLTEEKAVPTTRSVFGCFRNKVLWLGIEQGKKEVKNLARAARAALKTPFPENDITRVTLARNRKKQGKDTGKIVAGLPQQGVRQTVLVKKISLVESKHAARKPECAVLGKFHLA